MMDYSNGGVKRSGGGSRRDDFGGNSAKRSRIEWAIFENKEKFLPKSQPFEIIVFQQCLRLVRADHSFRGRDQRPDVHLQTILGSAG